MPGAAPADLSGSRSPGQSHQSMVPSSAPALHPGYSSSGDDRFRSSLAPHQLHADHDSQHYGSVHSPYNYPRPPGQSTPYSERAGGGPSAPSPSEYFPPQPYYASSTSPLPSPGIQHHAQLYFASPQAPQSTQSPVIPEYLPSAGVSAAVPIDRQALQRSLKSLEGLLVSLDEYRDLHAKLAKAEKKLGKNVRDLAGSMVGASGQDGDKGAGSKTRKEEHTPQAVGKSPACSTSPSPSFWARQALRSFRGAEAIPTSLARTCSLRSCYDVNLL